MTVWRFYQGVLLIGLVFHLNGLPAFGGGSVEELVFKDDFEQPLLAIPTLPGNPQAGSYPSGAVAPESQVVSNGNSVLNIVGNQRTYGDPTTATGVGDEVIFEADLYYAVDSAYVAFALAGDTANESLDGNPLSVWVQVTDNGDVQYRSGGTWIDTSLDHVSQTWQYYEVKYTVGEGTFDLTVGSATATGLSVNAVTLPTVINRVGMMGGTVGTVAYIDDVVLMSEGSPVFADDFEQTLAALPTFPDHPQIGSYPSGAISPESQVVSTGNSVLSIVGKQRTYGDPATVAEEDDAVTFEVDLHYANDLAYVSFALIGNTADEFLDGNPASLWVQVTNSGDVQYRNGGAWIDTGLNHWPQMWEHYSVNYTVGEETFDLTVGSATATGLSVNATTFPTAINQMAIVGGTEDTVAQVDNVVLRFENSLVFADHFQNNLVTLPAVPDNPQAGSYPGGVLAPESDVVLENLFLHIVGKQRTYGDSTLIADAGEPVTFDVDLHYLSDSAYVSFALIGNTANDFLDGNPASLWVQVTNSGDVEYRSGGTWVDTGLDHPHHTWQHYELKYTVGEGTFDLTVGSATATGLSVNAVTLPTLIDRVVLVGGTDDTVAYADNVELVFGKPMQTIAATVSQFQGDVEIDAEILSENVIVRQHERYIGWPTIVRAANDDLIVVFSGDRDWHVDPWGKIYLTRSTDDGQTWSTPEIIVDTPLDDRTPGLVVMGDGTLVLTYYPGDSFMDAGLYPEYQVYTQSLTQQEKNLADHARSVVSYDHGHTWENDTAQARYYVPHGPAALSDGSVLLFAHHVYKSSVPEGVWPKLIASPDLPSNWLSDYAAYSELHAVEAANGAIVAHCRYREKATGDIEIRQLKSTNGGLNWTQPEAVPGMDGYPAHLLRLDNDWLISVYSHRFSPLSERVSVSKDHGVTWLTGDEEIVLSYAVPQGAGDMGYPASAQASDGTIWTVYYQVEQTHGEFPSLMATHWRINNP